MVFNGLMVVTVAHASADAWQEMACIHSRDRLRSHQLLDLVFCLPLHRLGRLALCLWAFLCLPQPDSFYSYANSSSDDDEDDDDDGGYYHYYYDDDEDRDHDDAPGPGSASSSSSSSSSSSIDLPDYYYHSHSD